MNHDSLLEYLKSYVSDPKIISLDQLSEEERKKIPESWVEILSLKGDDRVKKALHYWGDFKKEFEQVIEYLQHNVVSIDLLHHGFGYCLLYGVKAANSDRVLYYEARNPKAKNLNPVIADIWDRLPTQLIRFYEFHNGWYYLASGSMGLSPVEDFFFLDEEDWGILDEIGIPSIDLKQTLAIFTNGMGGYVCLELRDENISCLLWWSNKPPKVELEFWSLVDSWTAMGFEG